MGSKKLLSGNSVMRVISWKNKAIFTEMILLFLRKTQFHMVKSIINAFDHIEFCFVINLTMGGNWAVIGKQCLLLGMLDYTGSKYLPPAKKVNF